MTIKNEGSLLDFSKPDLTKTFSKIFFPEGVTGIKLLNMLEEQITCVTGKPAFTMQLEEGWYVVCSNTDWSLFNTSTRDIMHEYVPTHSGAYEGFFDVLSVVFFSDVTLLSNTITQTIAGNVFPIHRYPFLLNYPRVLIFRNLR